MAMFASTGGDPERAAGQRPSGKDGGLSILAAGLRFTGELETEGVVKIEGTVEGSIRAHGQVLVTKTGVVEGNIFTREAIIGGRVEGEIFADERVEVQTSSAIKGDITTPRIVVQEGGELNGQVRMANPQAMQNRPNQTKETRRRGSGNGSDAELHLAVAGTRRAKETQTVEAQIG